jgi:hypothetical protein
MIPLPSCAQHRACPLRIMCIASPQSFARLLGTRESFTVHSEIVIEISGDVRATLEERCYQDGREFSHLTGGV